jgi:hypothetical protein
VEALLPFATIGRILNDAAYSSGTENSSLGSTRANQQGDCPEAGLPSLYGAEPGHSNHAEAGTEGPGSGGLSEREAGEYGALTVGCFKKDPF